MQANKFLFDAEVELPIHELPGWDMPGNRKCAKPKKRGVSRRALLFALPAIAAGQITQPQGIVQPQASDPWQELASAWNPFAEKLNKGVCDLKQWKKVVQAVERIEGRNCKR